ncbi:MAG: hypothetical protein LBT83_08390 [Tannerella sp.]|jgi:hypothetical protein|nr:hypothetical protein [Tannerella sp.]
MKAAYTNRFRKRGLYVTGILTVTLVIGTLFWWDKFGSHQMMMLMIFGPTIGTIFWDALKPCAKISGTDLIIRWKLINIYDITKVEEDEKKKINVTYLFLGEETGLNLPVPIHDKDKNRFITDLLSINQNIKVKTSF